VIFSVLPEAELEAAEAVIWYDDQRFGLGDDFLAELRQAYARIRNGPAELSRLESYTGRHDVRRCLLRRFPYLVTFLYRPEEVAIVAISHARRRPLYWLERIS
jgi:ParE toxin of type II toxin-antitoxin system, parDE